MTSSQIVLVILNSTVLGANDLICRSTGIWRNRDPSGGNEGNCFQLDIVLICQLDASLSYGAPLS